MNQTHCSKRVKLVRKFQHKKVLNHKVADTITRIVLNGSLELLVVLLSINQGQMHTLKVLLKCADSLLKCSPNEDLNFNLEGRE